MHNRETLSQIQSFLRLDLAKTPVSHERAISEQVTVNPIIRTAGIKELIKIIGEQAL